MKKFLVVASILVCVPDFSQAGLKSEEKPGFSQAEYHTRSVTEALEHISVRYYKHYEVDDKINNYLLNNIKNGITVFGGKTFDGRKKSNSKFPVKHEFKQKLVIKNVNKIVYKFAKEHSIKLNPSNIKSGLTYTWQDLGFVNVNQYGASVRMKIGF